jgi:hypothetical protein
MITTFALLGKFAIDYVSGWKDVLGLAGTELLSIRHSAFPGQEAPPAGR